MSFNILVVDDSITIRKVLSKILKMIELDVDQVVEAKDGKEALECLKQSWFDLVITDLNMPVMTGMELIDEMAADGLLKDIPVVVISTDGSTTRIEELKKKGVKEYIRKPFTPETVGSVISKALGVIHEKFMCSFP